VGAYIGVVKNVLEAPPFTNLRNTLTAQTAKSAETRPLSHESAASSAISAV